jgi:hypothetical protein
MKDHQKHLFMPSPYDDDKGHLIGRDPRQLTPDDFETANIQLMPVMKAIRAKCLDCVGSNPEIRKCVSVTCPLWPLRMGHFPKILRAGIKDSNQNEEMEEND